MKLLIAALILTGAQASAQGKCGPREVVAASLASKYQETPQFMGIGANGALVETYASRESGTWTLTVTSPNGITCLVASGQAFVEIIPGEPI